MLVAEESSFENEISSLLFESDPFDNEENINDCLVSQSDFEKNFLCDERSSGTGSVWH